MKLSAVGEGTKSNKHVCYLPPLRFHINCHLERAGRIGVKGRGDHAPMPQAGRVAMANHQ